MAVRHANDQNLYLLPQRTNADPKGVTGAVQVLLGAWLDADLSSRIDGWVQATDRSGRSGWIRENDLSEDPRLKIFYLDVGQGDAIVIESVNGIVIIDGGPNVGCRDWLLKHYKPVIDEQGQLNISAIVVTHFDTDHFQGVTSILKNDKFNVERLLHNGLPRYNKATGFDLRLAKTSTNGGISTDLDDLESAKAMLDAGQLMTKFGWLVKAAFEAHEAGRLGIMDRLCRRDPTAEAPKLPDHRTREPLIEVLAPVSLKTTGQIRLPKFPASADTSHTINGNSVVLALTYGNHRFLFGGDLNRFSQRYLLKKYPSQDVFKASVSKACHHGSADFDIKFLKATKPMATVFYSGDAGTYDHPMPEAIGVAGRHGRGTFPLVFSTELARETGSGGIHFGHINARSNGDTLIMAQKKELHTAKKTWFTYALPYKGPASSA